MGAGRLRVAALMLADTLCIVGVWAFVVFAYYLTGFGLYAPSAYLHAWPVIVLFLAINAVSRLYHGRGSYPGMPLGPVEEFRRLVLSALLTHLLVMAVLGFSREVEQISRVVLVVSAFLTAATAQTFRDILRSLLKRFGLGQIPAFVVGEGETATRLIQHLADDPFFGFRIVRRFGREELREIVAAGRQANVQHVFCCYRDDRFFQAQLASFTQQFAFVEYLPTIEAIPIAGARAIAVGTLGGLEMVNQRRMRLLAWEKNVIDFVLAFSIFIVALPFFLVVPILIKVTSPGPIFYRAKRLGKKGRPISVWKFRSMYRDADARLQSLLDADPALKAEFARDFKLKNDPRVTPLGRILRKTSIDELPQLFNVFCRDMALVGPRPIVEKEISYYGSAFEIFSSVRPGITGLWQASGRSDTDYAERVSLDVNYVLNWSPWLDVWIVFKTVRSVLLMRGSY